MEPPLEVVVELVELLELEPPVDPELLLLEELALLLEDPVEPLELLLAELLLLELDDAELLPVDALLLELALLLEVLDVVVEAPEVPVVLPLAAVVAPLLLPDEALLPPQPASTRAAAMATDFLTRAPGRVDASTHDGGAKCKSNSRDRWQDGGTPEEP